MELEARASSEISSTTTDESTNDISKKLITNSVSLKKLYSHIQTYMYTAVIHFFALKSIRKILEEVAKKEKTIISLTKHEVRNPAFAKGENKEYRYAVISFSEVITLNKLSSYGLYIHSLMPLCYDEQLKEFIYFLPDTLQAVITDKMNKKRMVTFTIRKGDIFNGLRRLRKKDSNATFMRLLYDEFGGTFNL